MSYRSGASRAVTYDVLEKELRQLFIQLQEKDSLISAHFQSELEKVHDMFQSLTEEKANKSEIEAISRSMDVVLEVAQDLGTHVQENEKKLSSLDDFSYEVLQKANDNTELTTARLEKVLREEMQRHFELVRRELHGTSVRGAAPVVAGAPSSADEELRQLRASLRDHVEDTAQTLSALNERLMAVERGAAPTPGGAAASAEAAPRKLAQDVQRVQSGLEEARRHFEEELSRTGRQLGALVNESISGLRRELATRADSAEPFAPLSASFASETTVNSLSAHIQSVELDVKKLRDATLELQRRAGDPLGAPPPRPTGPGFFQNHHADAELAALRKELEASKKTIEELRVALSTSLTSTSNFFALVESTVIRAEQKADAALKLASAAPARIAAASPSGAAELDRPRAARE